MRKAIIVGLMLCTMGVAYAETQNLDWVAWAFDHNASDLTVDEDNLSSAILNNYDVLWQLIYTPSGTPGTPDLADANFLGAGEELLDYRLLTASSSDPWNLALYTDETVLSSPDVGIKDSYDQYYVYQRIYELEPGTTAPVEGTWYADVALTDLTKEAKWNVQGATIALWGFGDEDLETGVKPNQQIPQTQSIPEPATMSLLGLGALVLGLRRKLRK